MRKQILFFLFLSCLSVTSFCFPPTPTTYYTIADGDWATGNIWSTNPNATTGSNLVSSVINSQDIIVIRHTVTSGSVQINNKGDIQITSTGYLDISSLTVNNGNPGGSMIVDAGGTLDSDNITDKTGGTGIDNSGTIITDDCSVPGISGTCVDAPLPVELISFIANSSQENLELSWATASELNNDYFTLEKSKNGLDFELITTVEGNGTTTIESNYDHMDQNPYLGLSFYRLSQTDYDGTTEVFPIISVVYTSDKNSFTVSPNPIRNQNVKLKASGRGRNEKIQLNIIDLQGKLIETTKLKSDNYGNLEVDLQLKNQLKKGTYIFEIVSEINKEYLKIVSE